MRILRKKLSVLLIGSSAATSLELMYLRAFKSSGYKNIYLLDIKKNFYFFQNKFLRKSLKFFESIYFSWAAEFSNVFFILFSDDFNAT